MEEQNTTPKKSRARAIASFVFGLAFWIPLLNMIFGLLAIYHGVVSLKNVKKRPDKYAGKWFAVIGIVLGSIVYMTYLIGFGMCLYGYNDICKTMGLEFLARQ